ncbi:hypothetical protein [Acinetobacter sp. WCHAc060025]|uniref:hypothetical protein n=1 Tax=Acinetobacter sp. WCHAc060025 TaxID=2518625 RepID=UPI0010232B20|nr:hypothetical protein [Acinetobacter sp. WCHAc060025]RZG74754.1 hypothetical protein EXE09_12235 [Acinetobacter sp. WCHAc060025]
MFESTFPRKWAEEIISRMQRYYRAKFSATFPMIEGQTAEQYEDDLIATACEVFEGLSPDDIKRGLTRMKRSTFCPTFPEFAGWCEPKTDEWLGSHEAWAIAEKSIGFDGQELTVIWTEQMAQAFSRCEDLIKTGDKYQRAEAKKIFCDAYDRLVTQAKDQGLKPIYVTSLGTDKDQQIAAINQATVDGFLTAPDATALLEHKQTKLEQLSESERYKTIAQEALAKLGPLIKRNPVNRMTEEHKEPQPWESIEDEHIDPFDNFEEYKAALRAEQKPLPNAVRFLDEQVGGGV